MTYDDGSMTPWEGRPAACGTGSLAAGAVARDGQTSGAPWTGVKETDSEEDVATPMHRACGWLKPGVGTA